MTDIRYNVIDLETSIKNRGEDAVGKMAASPFCDDNKIVLHGFRAYDNDETGFSTQLNGVYVKSSVRPQEYIEDVDVLVGHNIKFDILYLIREYPEIKKWLEGGGKIWCTQLAQYILEGQQKTFPSLDYSAEKWGGTLKDDRIKAFWDEGIDTEDIPIDMLKDYLADDVLNTEKVYLGQLQEAYQRGMLPLIESQMEGLLATIEMEHNGMYFDRQISSTEALRLHSEMQSIEAGVRECMSEFIDSDKIDINPYSNDQLSVVLFGGDLTYREDTTVLDEDSGEPVRYKSGKRKGEIKTRKEDKILKTIGLGYSKKYTQPLKKQGFYATNDKVLKSLSGPFPESLIELRKLKKDLTTYFIGYADLTWPNGLIHGSLHHCSTATGRLSSSAPNLQNLSGG